MLLIETLHMSRPKIPNKDRNSKKKWCCENFCRFEKTGKKKI